MDDYVELISDLIHEFGEARQVDLAARLGVSQPTVAKTLKRLANAGLVHQLPYRGTFLTPEGEKLAAENRERHNVVEAFFIALGISAKPPVLTPRASNITSAMKRLKPSAALPRKNSPNNPPPYQFVTQPQRRRNGPAALGCSSTLPTSVTSVLPDS